jgi:hypothetical protein
VELEQQVITLQSAQTQTTVQHNNTLLTRPRELEVDRDISALWTVVRQIQQEKEEQNRALEERIRLLEERVRGMACDREPPTRGLATPTEKPAAHPTSAPDKSLDTTAEQSTPDPDHSVDATAEQSTPDPDHSVDATAEQSTPDPDHSVDTTAEQSTPDPDHSIDITTEQSLPRPLPKPEAGL